MKFLDFYLDTADFYLSKFILIDFEYNNYMLFLL